MKQRLSDQFLNAAGQMGRAMNPVIFGESSARRNVHQCLADLEPPALWSSNTEISVVSRVIVSRNGEVSGVL